MPKTKEEIMTLKQEYLILKEKLEELTDDELKIVTGGVDWYGIDNPDGEFEHGSRLVENGKEHDEQVL